MMHRVRASLVIARHQARETLLSPGMYVTLTLGLLLGYFLVASFVDSIDSSGFNPRTTPLLQLVTSSFAGAFGSAFVEKLFAEGPFLFALAVSFAPVFLYLSITSVFRFGLEKNAGAVELLSYGPADGTSYFLASFLRDTVFTAGTLLVIAVFFRIAAGIASLALGPLFFAALPLLFLLSLAFSSWGILGSILAGNGASALAMFVGVLALFLAVLVGSFSVAGTAVQTVAAAIADGLQWVSPFFYAALGFRAFTGENAVGFAGSLALLALLSAVILCASHLLISRRGVRE